MRELEASYLATDAALDRLLDVSPASLLLDMGYDYVGFVSLSKGRGRKRRAPREVELYKDMNGWHQVPPDGQGPFDCIATETLHAVEESAVIDGLRAIPERKRVAAQCRSSLFLP